MKEIRFKKSLGQNFLKDQNVINNIIKEAGIEKDSLVIEIGPGSGALTIPISKKVNHLLCYEKDISLKEVLDKKIDHNNTEIIFDDFLKRNVKEDIKKYKDNHIYLVANLPYYITTPIIEKIIKENIDIEKITIMIQKEVAERWTSAPNHKEYSSITVFLNYFYDIKKLFVVNRKCFIPSPNVDSMVIQLTKANHKQNVTNINTFEKLIRDSFQFKRKTIANNLKQYDLSEIEKVLIKNNLSLKSRAEQIPLSVYIEISNNIK